MSHGSCLQVVGLLMAATQTLPLTLTWAMYHIGNDSSFMRAIRREVNALAREVCVREQIDPAQSDWRDFLSLTDVRDGLPYTEALIKGTIAYSADRLHSSRIILLTSHTWSQKRSDVTHPSH